MSEPAPLRPQPTPVHELAMGMPYVTVDNGTSDNPVYQVGGKSFIFFRNPRQDAMDPELVQDAWLSRASARRAATWLSAHPPV